MNTTLFTLTEEYKMLLDMAEDPNNDPQTVMDTMDAITGEIAVKVENYIAVMNLLQSKLSLFREEAKRLTDGANFMENNIKNMKERIKGAMIDMNLDAIETQYHTIKIQGNGGVQPLKITGEVPDSYKKITYSDDTEKIRKDLKAGKKLSFAHLEDRGTHLSIR